MSQTSGEAAPFRRQEDPTIVRSGAALPPEGMRGDLEFRTVPRLVRAAAERFESAEAVVDGPLRLSFVDLAAMVRNAASALIASGVQPGERVAVWAPNSWRWVVVALAVQEAGGVLVPLNTRYRGREAAEILARSAARALFTVNGFLDTEYLALLAGAGVALPALETAVLLEGRAPGGALDWEAFLARGHGVPSQAVERRVAEIRPEDVADILFTSGTTGAPKGVPSTHAQNLRVFRDWTETVGLRAGDRYLVVAPFFHSFGYKAGILASLMAGATVHPHAVFEPATVLDRVRREAITALPGPPALYQSLLAVPEAERGDLATLRLAVTGAAVIPVELIERMRRELGLERIITGYGLTETTGVVTMCHHEDDLETIARRCGRPIPGVEVRIATEDGRTARVGESGEVLVRGYNVTAGYLDDPEATRGAIDAEGWLRTGDVGTLDGRGYLAITDRKKDIFIVGGFKVAPAEVEHMLLEHDGVGEVAVVGVPDDRLGEVGKAFVVPRRGAVVAPAALIEWARRRMANFKVPRTIHIVDALPRNASGKVLKHVLLAEAMNVKGLKTS